MNPTDPSADEITKKFKAAYQQWAENPENRQDGYQFEQSFAQMWQQLGQQVFQASVGEVPSDKNRKKKVHTRFGKIQIDKTHVLAQTPGGMSISAYGQQNLCWVGQISVFREAEELINAFTGAGFNAKQIERVCHQYGQWLEEADRQAIAEEFCRSYGREEAKERHYIGIDGSMYLTRRQGWKEVKMARIYSGDALVETSEGRRWLPTSSYVGHLGEASEFLPKLTYHIEALANKVFVCDGAQWIWNWIEDRYPESRQIVDYYHAAQHLCEFAGRYFSDSRQREQWTDTQRQLMLAEGIDPVIEAIKALPEDRATREQRRQLLGYYQRHRHRMQYHKFRREGLQIGSGAIESAHKDVLQARLKRSGQRWSWQGLQQMVQLRVAYKSGNQSRIKQLARKAA